MVNLISMTKPLLEPSRMRHAIACVAQFQVARSSFFFSTGVRQGVVFGNPGSYVRQKGLPGAPSTCAAPPGRVESACNAAWPMASCLGAIPYFDRFAAAAALCPFFLLS